MPPISREKATPTQLLGEPTRVTVHLKDFLPHHLAQELSILTGVEIRLQMRDEETARMPVTIDLDNQPFWTVIREVCAKLKLAPVLRPGASSLVLHHSDANWAQANFISLSPHITLHLSSSADTHAITPQGDDRTVNGVKPVTDTHKMTVRGMLLFDPKLRLVQDDMPITIIEARDDNGVAVVDLEQKPFISGESSLIWSVRIPLQGRAVMEKQAVRLSARVQAAMVSGAETLYVSDVLNGQDVSKTVKTRGGEATYTFLGVEKIADQYQVSIQVSRPPTWRGLVLLSKEEKYRHLRRLHRDLVRMAILQDTEGRRYQWRGASGPDPGGKITINFSAAQEGEKPGTPEELFVPIILEAREMEITFELNGLPLP
jgi:hypothetical protein